MQGEDRQLLSYTLRPEMFANMTLLLFLQSTFDHELLFLNIMIITLE